MVMKTFDIALVSVEAVIYFFHSTVFLLLVVQRNKTFKGAFYNLMRIIFLADLGFILAQYIVRLSTFGLWRRFYEANGYLASVSLNITGLCAFVQFFAHTLIAFNRFTIFWFPTWHSTIWSKPWYSIIVITLPLIAIVHRIAEPGVFVYYDDGEVFARFVNDSTRTIAYYITSSVFSSMTIIQALCNLLAIIKYYFYKNTNTNVDNKEVQLLGLSCALFLFQSLRCAHNFGRLIFPNNEEINLLLQTLLPVISDLYAWTGSISLILLSTSTRRAYLKCFLKCITSKQFYSDSTGVPQYPITFNSHTLHK